MEAKLRGTTGLPFEVEEIPVPEDGIPFARYFADNEGNVYMDSVLEFVNETPAPAPREIEGWMAVDEWGMGGLFLHTQMPHAESREFCDTGDYESGWESDGEKYELDSKFFPDMTPESEPKRVKITITPIEDDARSTE